MSADVINYGRCARTLRKRFVPQCVGALQKLKTTLLNAVWIIHIIWFATVCLILGYALKIPHRNSERVGPIPRTKRSRPETMEKRSSLCYLGFGVTFATFCDMTGLPSLLYVAHSRSCSIRAPASLSLCWASKPGMLYERSEKIIISGMLHWSNYICGCTAVRPCIDGFGPTQFLCENKSNSKFSGDVVTFHSHGSSSAQF